MTTALSERCKLRNFTAGDMSAIRGDASVCAVLTKLDPDEFYVGTYSANLWLTGRHFAENTVVTVNGTPVEFICISATSGYVTLSGPLLTTPQTLTVNTDCAGSAAQTVEVVTPPAWPASGACSYIGPWTIGSLDTGMLQILEGGFEVCAIDGDGLRHEDLADPDAWEFGSILEIKGPAGSMFVRIAASPPQDPTIYPSDPPCGLMFTVAQTDQHITGTKPSLGDPVTLHYCAPVIN